jgi:hypothetical protein
MKPGTDMTSIARLTNLRLAWMLGAFALMCYGGIYAYYVIRP